MNAVQHRKEHGDVEKKIFDVDVEIFVVVASNKSVTLMTYFSDQPYGAVSVSILTWKVCGSKKKLGRKSSPRDTNKNFSPHEKSIFRRRDGRTGWERGDVSKERGMTHS